MGNTRELDRAMQEGLWMGQNFAAPLVVEEGFRQLLATPSRMQRQFELACTGKKAPMAGPGPAFTKASTVRSGPMSSPLFPPGVLPGGATRQFSTIAVNSIRRIGRLL